MSVAHHTLPPHPDFDKPLPVGLRMSEEEFIAWYTFEGQAEWVDGEVIVVPPVSGEHDSLQAWIRSVLGLYVEHTKCGKAFGPQFVTRLTVRRRKVSRREPDIHFVAAERLSKVKPNHLEGPPDLSIEIVSPESKVRDRRQKYAEYEAAGVREYWIVDPMSQTVELFVRQNDKFVASPEADGKLTSTVVPGWYLRPAWLWHKPRISALAALAELGVRA